MEDDAVKLPEYNIITYRGGFFAINYPNNSIVLWKLKKEVSEGDNPPLLFIRSIQH